MPPIPIRLGDRPNLRRYLQLPLATEEVRYVGEPVAVVVAGNRYEAEDALERADLAYEDLPVSNDATSSSIIETLAMCKGGVDVAFKRAAVVVRERFCVNRQAACPLETRGLVAAWDAVVQRLTVWGAAKFTHINRDFLAQMLGVPAPFIRAVEVHTGGGFGVRGEFYPEDFLIPWVALRLGVPICWAEDRREHLEATNHSREVICDASLALDTTGHMLALQCEAWYDIGAYVRTNGLVPAENTIGLLPGPYAIDSFDLKANIVLTNKTPVGTYRGPGFTESTFVRERLVDMAAGRLGVDPAELRRRNLIRPSQLPFDVGTTTMWGQSNVLRSGDYPGLFQKALDAFGYKEIEPRSGRGVGIACFVDRSARPGWEYARVAVDPTGLVTVYVGGASLGQGIETVLAQICAEKLGVRFEDVAVVHGDTDLVPYGSGSGASRTTVIGGNAVAQAAARVRARALGVAAQHLEARIEDLELENGRLVVRGTPSRTFSLADVARFCTPGATQRAGFESGLDATAFWQSTSCEYSFGVHLVEAKVDDVTGHVEIVRDLLAYDPGRAVNPALLRGQLIGATAQGIGGTLYEELCYDARGQLLTGSLMDYLMPTATEVPRIDVLLWEKTPTGNPLGIAGGGEAGVIGVSAAVSNAVAAASCSGLKCNINRLPLKPELVLSILGAS